MNENLPARSDKKNQDQNVALTHNTDDYVTFSVAGQNFGIQVLQVQDILGPQRITRIPLAPREVAGALNLRGRIVTAIDVRTRLNLPTKDISDMMSIVADRNGELYALLVDDVSEVLSLEQDKFEKNPANLHPTWREVSGGIYRLEGQLLVVLDVARLLQFVKVES